MKRMYHEKQLSKAATWGLAALVCLVFVAAPLQPSHARSTFESRRDHAAKRLVRNTFTKDVSPGGLEGVMYLSGLVGSSKPNCSGGRGAGFVECTEWFAKCYTGAADRSVRRVEELKNLLVRHLRDRTRGWGRVIVTLDPHGGGDTLIQVQRNHGYSRHTWFRLSSKCLGSGHTWQIVTLEANLRR